MASEVHDTRRFDVVVSRDHKTNRDLRRVTLRPDECDAYMTPDTATSSLASTVSGSMASTDIASHATTWDAVANPVVFHTAGRSVAVSASALGRLVAGAADGNTAATQCKSSTYKECTVALQGNSPPRESLLDGLE